MPRKKGKKGHPGNEGGKKNHKPYVKSLSFKKRSSKDPVALFTKPTPGHFSMKDEARNTVNHEWYGQTAGTQLRHAGITFVSAGAYDPSEILREQQEQQRSRDEMLQDSENTSLEDDVFASENIDDSEILPNNDQEDQMLQDDILDQIIPFQQLHLQNGRLDTTTDSEDPGEDNTLLRTRNIDPGFVVDTQGDQTLRPNNIPPPIIFPPNVDNHDTSDSSEKVVFVPRRKKSQAMSTISRPTSVRPGNQTSRPANVMDEVLDVVDDTPKSLPGTTKPTTMQQNNSRKPRLVTPSHNSIENKLKSSGASSRTRRRRRGRKERSIGYANGREDDNDEDEATRDFIENLRANMEDDSTESFLVQGAIGASDDDDDEVLLNEQMYMEEVSKHVADDRQVFWNTQKTHTMAVDPDLIIMLLDKREGSDGVQYLVIATESHGREDPIWTDIETVREICPEAIEFFEAGQLPSSVISENDSSNEDEDEERDSQGSEVDEEAEEEDAEMDDVFVEAESSDEAVPNNGYDADQLLAELLQAEENRRGLRSNSSIHMIDHEIEIYEPEELIDMMSGKNRHNGKFPSASRLADAYDQLGRDSAQYGRVFAKHTKGKGKGKTPVFDNVDSELEDSLEQAWHNDRLAKRIKKAEREVQRGRGLLDKSARSEFLAKYPLGMSIKDIQVEIKVFLLGESEVLNLVPMNKNDRKHVHQLATQFNLKSKSLGVGNNRYPVLYKTKRTSLFTVDEVMIDRIFNRNILIGKSRLGTGGGGGGRRLHAAALKKRGNASNAGGHKHQDGDIVGVGAAEIGVENRGRAMLEKMGWSLGMGLGAEGRSGRTEPVVAIVKTTRTGLG